MIFLKDLFVRSAVPPVSAWHGQIHLAMAWGYQGARARERAQHHRGCKRPRRDAGGTSEQRRIDFGDIWENSLFEIFRLQNEIFPLRSSRPSRSLMRFRVAPARAGERAARAMDVWGPLGRPRAPNRLGSSPAPAPTSLLSIPHP